MSISIVRNNFSQFNDGVELCVEENNTRVVIDVSKKELPSFAHDFMDMAYDFLKKYGDEKYEQAMDKICEALTLLNNA